MKTVNTLRYLCAAAGLLLCCGFGECEPEVEPGPQGPQGEPGPQGEVGPMGPQGIQGETGAEGPVGATGVQGLQGELGPQGVQGDTGPQGSVGVTGPQGLQGEIGLQGVQGTTGATGPEGVIGPSLQIVDDLNTYIGHVVEVVSFMNQAETNFLVYSDSLELFFGVKRLPWSVSNYPGDSQIGFTSSNCTGQAYVEDNQDHALLRSDGAYHYSVQTGASPVTVTINSQLDINAPTVWACTQQPATYSNWIAADPITLNFAAPFELVVE